MLVFVETFAHVVDDSAPLSPDRQELERGATYSDCGPCSCLVSSQEVASPSLPNGCGQQLHGPETIQGQKKGTSSDVACSQATPSPSPLGLPRETRGPNEVHGARDEVLRIPLRNHVP